MNNCNQTNFNYQLLARLQQDCEYYLGYGNRAKKHLWAGDEVAQIQKMKALYEELPEKPEWISLEAIERFEAEMVAAPTPDTPSFDNSNVGKNVLVVPAIRRHRFC